MTQQIGLQAIFETAAFQRGLGQFIQGLDKARGATQQTADTSSNAGTLISAALGGALGALAGTIIPQVISAFGDMVKSSISAVAELQRLDIMLETLTARQIVQGGAADTMTEALAKAGPVADMLMGQLRELSLISPFEYTDVVNTFRLNVAFGQSTETAMGLTKAILDLSSGMGLTGPFLERIAYNFSQMSLTGKITMRDVRDLAMAGVDLADVLRSQLGMSIEETNAALESGKITFEDVSKAFIGYVEKNFAGAAERMSRSLSGLSSSFKDLGFFASQDLFGPLLTSLTDDLGGLYDQIKGFIDSGGLRDIGVGLGLLYDSIKSLPGVAIEAGTAIVETLFGPLEGAASDAFAWGSNIISQLAEGIINTAADVLVAAMNYVGELLAYWLAPGSPPRVAPQMDAWGQSAMEQFLEGFTEADFDILKDLQGSLSSVFGILEQSGAMAEGQAGGLLANFSQMFAEALSGGELDASFFADLESAAGPFGDELVQLAEQNLALSKAMDAAADAQKRLNEAEKAQEAALTKVSDMTGEYNAMLKGGASEADLAAKLEAINAAEEAARLAGEQKDAAKNDLENSQDRVDALKEQISLTEDLIEQLVKLTQATIAPEKPTVPEAPGAGGGAGAKKPSGGAGAGVGGGIGSSITDSINKALEAAKGSVTQSAEEMKAALIEKLRTAFDPILQAWRDKFGPTWDRLTEGFENFKTNLQKAWDGFVTNFQKGLETARQWWSEFWPKLRKFAEDAIGAIKNGWNSLTEIFVKGLKASLNDDLMGKLVLGFDNLKDGWSRLMEVLGSPEGKAALEGIGKIIGAIGGALAGLAGFILGVVVNAAVGLVGSFMAIWGWGFKLEALLIQVFGGITQFVTGLPAKWEQFKTDLANTWESAKNTVSEKWEAMKEAISTKLSEIGEQISGGLNRILEKFGITEEIKERWRKIWEDVKLIAQEIWDRIVEAVGGWLSNILEKLKSGFGAVKQWWNEAWSYLSDLLAPVWDQIKQTVSNLVSETAEIVRQIGEEIKKAWQEIWGSFKDSVVQPLADAWNQVTATLSGWATSMYEIGVNVIQGLIDGVTGKISEWVESVTGGVEDGIQSVKDALQISSPSEVFKGFGVNIIQGLINGISEMLSDLGASIDEIAATVVDGITDVFSGGWEDAIGGAAQFIKDFTKELDKKAREIVRAVQKITDKVRDTFKTGFEKAKAEIAKAITKIVSEIEKRVNDFKKAAQAVIDGFIEGVKSKVSAAVAQVQNMVQQMVRAIQEKLGDFLTKGKEIVDRIIEGIKAKVSALLDRVRTMVTDMISALRQRLTEFYTKGQEMVQKIIDGIAAKFSALRQKAIDAVTEFINALRTKLTEIYNAGRDLITRLIEGLASKMGELWTNGGAAIGKWLDGIRGRLTEMYNAGKDAIGRFLEGMVAKATEVIRAAQNLAQQIVDAIMSIINGSGAGTSSTAAPLMMTIGSQIIPPTMPALPQGMTVPVRYAAQASANFLGPYNRMATQPIVSGGVTMNINLGGVEINSGMDLVTFEASVTRIAKKVVGLS